MLINDMSTTHTPGPWRLDLSQTGLLVHVLDQHQDENGGGCIAAVYARTRVCERGRSVGVVDEPTGMANARLIAAAPDLLAALQGALLALESVDRNRSVIDDLCRRAGMPSLGWCSIDAAMPRARAAIAKATGPGG